MESVAPLAVIDEFYSDSPQLRALLITHSELVARKALAIAEGCGIPGLDLQFIREAAMLHDIGIFRTDAPGIFCHGALPYICHGVEGSSLLGEKGLLRHALVCERHTGAGLTCEEIIEGALPLPQRDMLPVSHEEKIICLADKFYSKSGDPTQEKPMERVLASMAKFGPASLERFKALVARYL